MPTLPFLEYRRYDEAGSAKSQADARKADV
jgi:hypothetical protein